MAAGEFSALDAAEVVAKTVGDAAARFSKRDTPDADHEAARAAAQTAYRAVVFAALKHWAAAASEAAVVAHLTAEKNPAILSAIAGDEKDPACGPAAARAAGANFLATAFDAAAEPAVNANDAGAASTLAAVVKAVAAADLTSAAAVAAALAPYVEGVKAAADKTAYFGLLVEAWAALSATPAGEREVIIALAKALVASEAVPAAAIGCWRDASSNQSPAKMKGLLAVGVWLNTVAPKAAVVVQQFDDDEEDNE